MKPEQVRKVQDPPRDEKPEKIEIPSEEDTELQSEVETILDFFLTLPGLQERHADLLLIFPRSQETDRDMFPILPGSQISNQDRYP